MKITKSMQPCDLSLEKLRYSCLVSPKIDGVKLVRFNGKLTGRSFKPFRNKHLNELFDRPEFEGLEGEVIAGTNPYNVNLCRITTSAVNSFEGSPVYTWLVFDYVTEETIDLTYTERLEVLWKLDLPDNIRIVHIHTVYNQAELLNYENHYLELGAEGIIARDPNGKYKQGRVTVNSQECLRLKRFSDSECIVTGFNEQMLNTNTATVNELGRTTRTSHQDNLIGKNTLGSLNVRELNTGIEFSIGTGFDDSLRQEIWDNQDSYIGKIVKYKFFDKGIKELPRFPSFLSFRIQEDLPF